MKSFISLLVGIVLLIPVDSNANGQTGIPGQQAQANATYVSLDGKILSKGNPSDTDGFVHKFNSPALHLIRTNANSPKGTVLLLPGGDYEILNVKNEGEKAAIYLNTKGFDVAMLEYNISKDPQIRNIALTNALKAFSLIKTSNKTFGLRGDRFGILGISAGGHLAARMVQKLNEKEQPNDLILINPSYLDETVTGGVFPEVMPPLQPDARLFVSFSNNTNKAWIHSGEEYSKTWKGYDGQSVFYLLNDSVSVAEKYNNPFDSKFKLAGILGSFLEAKSEVLVSEPNPAALPVEGYAKRRHAEKLALIAKEKFDLIMIGNSITHNFEKPEYQPVWDQYFAPRKALNLGTSAYRTENIIWNIQNGELDGQSPKVVVLEIGTNNIDEKNFPTRHTAGQLAGGIETIVNLLREKLPDTKIVILRCFPGCYGGPNPTSHRAILERASDIVSRLADRKHVFYCDINHVFLNLDGSINHDMMSDWLHPTPAGTKAWAQAMEPLLSELLGDKSLDTEISSNTAIVPVPKLENDSYDWWKRHSEVLRIKDSINPEIVLIGNSITHFWGGEPKLRYADGRLRIPNGPKAWDSLFSNYRVLNLGFGWDRTQNVLWRLDRGELDGLHPLTVIINIGTNNTSQTSNARKNTAPEIVEGIRSICMRVRSKVPNARIILIAVFPREQNASNPRRMLINEINKQLETFANDHKITFVDIGSKMLDSNGTILPGMTSDFCHPTEKGYQIWADALRSILNGDQNNTIGKIADKPLFRDPVYDGAADPAIIWNRNEKKWFMFYTNRRANAKGLDGVSWVHGTRIGIAESSDGGATWKYRDTCDIQYRLTDYTHWAPEVVENNGLYHMFLSYVPGIFTNWDHPRWILHLTSKNLISWKFESKLNLSSDRCIDACVFRLPGGTWRMYYNNETDGKSMYYTDSPDLYKWTDSGKKIIGDRAGEGPNVFNWKGKNWMVVDNWNGIGIYSSEDFINWNRQEKNILQEPGKGIDDKVIGGHPDVVVNGEKAYIFYFTHPGRTVDYRGKDDYQTRRSSIQVAELEYAEGQIICNRDKPVYINLSSP